jgi:hypothetical protein
MWKQKAILTDGLTVGFGLKKIYFISNDNKESSSIKASISSPTTNSPTPAGVPVNTRSPIFTEK